MSQLLKKFVQSKVIEFFISLFIVYGLLLMLAAMNVEVNTIDIEDTIPTPFFKLYKPKTIALKSTVASALKTEKKNIEEKAVLPKKEELKAAESEPPLKEAESQEDVLEVDDVPIDLSQVDDATPVVLKSIRPNYPEVAKKVGVEASLLLELIINEKGKVMFSHVIYCNQPGYGFEESAKRAASKLMFKPFTKDGIATKVKIVYPINFKLI
ncbi:MAG: hypothetical protein CMP39_06715 [Rickettsiales bacterium]|nr:hypothetical protein [Rickettsiales bacterium]